MRVSAVFTNQSAHVGDEHARWMGALQASAFIQRVESLDILRAHNGDPEILVSI
jgi:hypothetical protein